MIFDKGSRNVSYRVDIYTGEIKKGELEAEPPTVSMDSEINSTDAAVKYSSTFLCRDNPQIDWHKDRYKIIFIENGIEKSLGMFLPQSVEREYTGSTLLSITGYDLLILPKNDCITERLSIAKGSQYLEAIESLLISSGMTRIIADDSTATLQSDRDDWDIGTSKLKIVNQLLSEMSFKSVETDSNGAALLKRYVSPTAEHIQHTYSADKASIIETDTEINSNLFEIPNIWVATISNPDLDTALTYKYVNDNPLSKTSTTYTGQNKVKTLNIDNIATQADLENAVTKQAFEDMQGIETIKFNTAVVAEHGVNDIVALQLPQYNGILTETAWEINLEEMTMTHTGKRAIENE